MYVIISRFVQNSLRRSHARERTKEGDEGYTQTPAATDMNFTPSKRKTNREMYGGNVEKRDCKILLESREKTRSELKRRRFIERKKEM